ncbi:MAG: hypothetical protein CM1200mP15_03250 [Dehalococcoidia bacterium]|nr:MAG: hypothetical protein CM1200mP15_03250 [Dehalococcoidia bacterium]
MVEHNKKADSELTRAKCGIVLLCHGSQRGTRSQSVHVHGIQRILRNDGVEIVQVLLWARRGCFDFAKSPWL